MRARVALFLPHLEHGGSQVVAVRLANGFAARDDIDVDILLVRRSGIHLNDLSGRIRILDLQGKHALASVPRLVRYLKESRPDCVLSFQGSENIAAAIARQIASVPTRIVASEHSLLSARTDMPRWRLRVAFQGRRLAYGLVDKVVTVSHAIARDLIQLTGIPESKVVTIHNPIDLEQVDRLSKEELTHPFFRHGTPVILSAGRLGPEKDFETLLRAFARVAAQREVYLVILGAGSLKSDLERLKIALGLKERVDFPGFVPNPFPFMAQASLFVLSSRYEGFPNVLIEAMACGCPVVSTDFQGVREALGDSEFGLISPVADPVSLADNMVSMLNSPIPDEKLRAKCLPLNADAIVGRYLAVLLPGNATLSGEPAQTLSPAIPRQ